LTPEHVYTLWVAGLTALPTITFTGFVAYWTWRRDQERLVVKVFPLYLNKKDDSITRPGGIAGVVVVSNLSLFAVGVCGVTLQLMPEDEFFGQVGGGIEFPTQVGSHARLLLPPDDEQFDRLQRVLETRRIDNERVVAVVFTETGGKFTSDSLRQKMARLRGRLRRLRAKRWHRAKLGGG
jgi:hypothetical protein